MRNRRNCDGITNTTGVPKLLFMQAKALAALNRKTMKDFICEAIAHAVREEKQKWLLQEDEIVTVHNEVEEIDRLSMRQ